MVSPPEAGEAFHLELELKGRGRSHDEDCSQRRPEPAPRVSTFVNAVEFSKTRAASDGVKKPPTRARGHREHTHRIGWVGLGGSCGRVSGLFNAARLDGPGSIAPISGRS